MICGEDLFQQNQPKLNVWSCLDDPLLKASDGIAISVRSTGNKLHSLCAHEEQSILVLNELGGIETSCPLGAHHRKHHKQSRSLKLATHHHVEQSLCLDVLLHDFANV